MSTMIEAPATPRQDTGARRTAPSLGGLGFDWAAMGLATVFLGGLYLDGWAHQHGRVDASFFTPWHAFFYSGFLLAALLLAVMLVAARSISMCWLRRCC